MAATLFDVALEGRIKQLEAILAQLVAEVHFGIRRGNIGGLIGTRSPIYLQAVKALGEGYSIPEPYVADNGQRFYIDNPLGTEPPSENKAHYLHQRTQKGARRERRKAP